MILFFFSFSSIDISELFGYDWFLTVLSPFNINFVQCICLLLFFLFSFEPKPADAVPKERNASRASWHALWL